MNRRWYNRGKTAGRLFAAMMLVAAAGGPVCAQTAAVPDDCPFWDGWPGPAGYEQYWNRVYRGD